LKQSFSRSGRSSVTLVTVSREPNAKTREIPRPPFPPDERPKQSPIGFYHELKFLWRQDCSRLQLWFGVGFHIKLPTTTCARHVPFRTVLHNLSPQRRAGGTELFHTVRNAFLFVEAQQSQPCWCLDLWLVPNDILVVGDFFTAQSLSLSCMIPVDDAHGR
jgi:hypothetical protein